MRSILIILFTIFTYGNSYEVVESFGGSVLTINNKSIKKITSKVTKKEHNLKSKIVYKKAAIKSKKIYTKKAPKRARAKLAIIIDDVSHKYQLNYIKSLPFKVTPSIFPPSRMNMKSYLLTKGLKHYMVHLPLQSDSKAMNKMHKTLFINSSNMSIRDRVLEIKRLFPSVKYLNNHTGSVFSKNYNKSKVLYKALLDSNITFLDSRTSKNTKFRKIAKEFNRRYYKCDNYIDNTLNTQSILREIKKGVSIAKHKGYAVIIGHPHKQTFKALKLAKKYFKDIDVVYIDEL